MIRLNQIMRINTVQISNSSKVFRSNNPLNLLHNICVLGNEFNA